jgi:hypothetical protein
MNTTVTSERTYSVSYFRPASKSHYGISIQVHGDRKTKVLHEAKELLIQAELDANQVSKSYEPVVQSG